MYSADSSALIAAWVEHYPIDVFPSVWHRLGGLAASGRLLVCEEIAEEIKRKEDGLHDWLSQFPDTIVPIDGPVQAAVRKILAAHPRLLDTRKNKSGGDPFVIALAQTKGPAVTVVTAELATGSLQRPKIPDVCAADGINVACIGLVQMFRAERFVVE